MGEAKKDPQYFNYLIIAAMILIFFGMVLIFLGTALSGGEVSTGGIFLIGPIPIVFGGGPLGQVLALLATIMTIILIALMLFWRTQKASRGQPKDIAT